MDYRDSPAEAEFRARLRTWLADHDPGLPTSSTDDDYWAQQAEWHTALYDAGFFGLSWPGRYGGHDRVRAGAVRRGTGRVREHDRRPWRRLACRHDDRQPRAGARRARVRRPVRQDGRRRREGGARRSDYLPAGPARRGGMGLRA